MSEEQIQGLKIQLAKLEEQVLAHTNSSSDFRKDIKTMLSVLQKEMREMLDGVHKRKKECFDDAKSYTNERVIWAISIPTLIIVLMKLFEAFK